MSSVKLLSGIPIHTLIGTELTAKNLTLRLQTS